MKWIAFSSGSKSSYWERAWWVEENGTPLRFNGQKIYIVTLWDEPGFFLYGSGGKQLFGPFETLELAKLTYELVVGGTT